MLEKCIAGFLQTKCPFGVLQPQNNILVDFLLPLFLILRSDLIDFDNLKRSNAHYNLQNAFNVAEKELGLTKLLDPEGESKYMHHFN